MKKLMLLICTFLSASLCASSTFEPVEKVSADLIEAPLQATNNLLDLTVSVAKESVKRTPDVLTGNDLQHVTDTETVRPLVISPASEDDLEEEGILVPADDQEDNEEEGLNEIPFE